YDYVNLDDCWMNGVTPRDTTRKGQSRDAAGNILPNKYFPDMKGLTDYIHSKGLKAGIYTSPGPLTCAGHTGSLGHAAQDAKQFADWGFDFLKYDWCSYEGIYTQGPQTMEMIKKPYSEMGAILKEQKRDIVYNLCYAKNEVWTWGEEVGGHSWRTAFDLGGELYRLFEVALNDAEYRQWSKPGSWNDADYLQIGHVNAKSPRPSHLTPNEQYSFMSMWALIASPLIYSGDLSRIDEFTLNILCNPEVIDVNQDPLGKSADVIKRSEDNFVMVKELEDGSRAIGFVNSGEGPSEISISWKEAGLQRNQVVRDLWRHKDLGTFKKEFKVTVPRRSVFLIKANKVK
ncbi:MAG TPA: glycoside hydrolase family 27 protein, partial [Sphingobacteriaceae bacterium]